MGDRRVDRQVQTAVAERVRRDVEDAHHAGAVVGRRSGTARCAVTPTTGHDLRHRSRCTEVDRDGRRFRRGSARRLFGGARVVRLGEATRASRRQVGHAGLRGGDTGVAERAATGFDDRLGVALLRPRSTRPCPGTRSRAGSTPGRRSAREPLRAHPGACDVLKISTSSGRVQRLLLEEPPPGVEDVPVVVEHLVGPSCAASSRARVSASTVSSAMFLRVVATAAAGPSRDRRTARLNPNRA